MVFYLRNGNECCHIWKYSRGDLEIRIIGKDKFESVSKIPFPDCYLEEAKLYANKASDALYHWFSNPDIRKEYRTRALEGKENPHETWKEITRRFNIPKNFQLSNQNKK